MKVNRRKTVKIKWNKSTFAHTHTHTLPLRITEFHAKGIKKFVLCSKSEKIRTSENFHLQSMPERKKNSTTTTKTYAEILFAMFVCHFCTQKTISFSLLCAIVTDERASIFFPSDFLLLYLFILIRYFAYALVFFHVYSVHITHKQADESCVQKTDTHTPNWSCNFLMESDQHGSHSHICALFQCFRLPFYMCYTSYLLNVDSWRYVKHNLCTAITTQTYSPNFSMD